MDQLSASRQFRTNQLPSSHSRDDDLGRSERFTLKQPSLFAGLTQKQKARVIECASRIRLQRNETLFRQGEAHRGVYLIEKGLLKTFYTSAAGREITLAYWLPGNVVGTPHILSASRHIWSGVATASSEVLAFRRDDLRQLIERIPSFAVAVVEMLEFKGWCLSALVQMLGTRSVAERLATLLCNLSELHGTRMKEGVAIGRPFTHEVLAHMVGASRQWVTMTLDKFEAEGLVHVTRSEIVVLNPRKLQARPGSNRD